MGGLYKVREVAALCDVSPGLIYRMISSVELRPVRVRRVARIHQREVERLMSGAFGRQAMRVHGLGCGTAAAGEVRG